MISLLKGCRRSEITVTPTNWDSKNAKTNKPWRIHYRFYDGPKSLQRVIKGMNHLTDLKARQALTKQLLEWERTLIDEDGYNPITKEYMAVDEGGELSPDTKLMKAFEIAQGMLQVGPDFMADVKSVLKYIKKAAGKLEDTALNKKYSELRIGQVKRRHLVYLIEHVRKERNLSNYRVNKYRTTLIILFNKLLTLEAVESNPALSLQIEKHTYKKRRLLTAAEWLIIDTNLKAINYYYWRYFRIFFRSGSRSSELLTLKNDRNIDLEKQEFTIVVKKGRNYKEDVRPIPIDVMDLWVELLNETKPGEYLFSSDFKPGIIPLRKEHTNRKWKKLVKEGMGIDKDFYSLKHLNADLIAERLGLSHAAAAAGIDEKTMRRHYAVGEKQREIDVLKGVRVEF